MQKMHMSIRVIDLINFSYFFLLRFGGDDCEKRASGAFGAPSDCGKDINATINWKSLEGEVTANGPLDNSGMTLRQAECHYHIRVLFDHYKF